MPSVTTWDRKPEIMAVGAAVAVADFHLPRANVPKDLDAGVPPGRLAMLYPEEMPEVNPKHYHRWAQEGRARCCGSGNVLPAVKRLGIKATALANVGTGKYNGYDPQGTFLREKYEMHDVGHVFTAECGRQTGTTFIIKGSGAERDGIVFGPGAGLELSLEATSHRLAVARPTIVHVMYQSLLGEENDRALPAYLER